MHAVHTVITQRAIHVDGVCKDVGDGAIHSFHCRLVTHPRDLHFIEAHAFNHAGIIGRKKRIDLDADALIDFIDHGFDDLMTSVWLCHLLTSSCRASGALEKIVGFLFYPLHKTFYGRVCQQGFGSIKLSGEFGFRK